MAHRPFLCANAAPVDICDDHDDALTGALTGKPDSPDLAAVVNAWPDLPQHTRKAILAIVKAVRDA